jgi:hypothetical protein
LSAITGALVEGTFGAGTSTYSAAGTVAGEVVSAAVDAVVVAGAVVGAAVATVAGASVVCGRVVSVVAAVAGVVVDTGAAVLVVAVTGVVLAPPLPEPSLPHAASRATVQAKAAA